MPKDICLTVHVDTTQLNELIAKLEKAKSLLNEMAVPKEFTVDSEQIAQAVGESLIHAFDNT